MPFYKIVGSLGHDPAKRVKRRQMVWIAFKEKLRIITGFKHLLHVLHQYIVPKKRPAFFPFSSFFLVGKPTTSGTKKLNSFKH